MSPEQGRVRIGTAGYQYDHWVGPFYPADIPKSRWFDYYAQRFAALEVNGTFYSLPKPETVARWRQAAPEGFIYALKFSRYGTHIKRLKDPPASLERFAEVVEALGETCGPILLQLPPRWRPNPERLDDFLRQAPEGWRWAVEVRDERWLREEVYAVLRSHNAALCWHDMLPEHPVVPTASWSYRRFHGDHYAGGYSEGWLAEQALAIGCELASGRDVFAFFNNDLDGHAPNDALALLRRLQS